MLDGKKKYLQVALNSTPSEAEYIIASLPVSERIIIEAGTPLIKAYGVYGIRSIAAAWQKKLGVFQNEYAIPYIVADTKCMDRGKTEVAIAQAGGASAATVLGIAPIETINVFIEACESFGLDAMIDMMNVEQPFKILRKLKQLPRVVILHRGVDEEAFNKDKPLPYIQINKLRSTYDVMIAMAGGDTIREVQRSIFNDIDIVVVWKDFYSPTGNAGLLAQQFLREIK